MSDAGQGDVSEGRCCDWPRALRLLALVTLPMPLCWLIIFTTPAALYFAIKHWNDPSPLFPRGKWRQWLTVAIAILQVILIVSLVVFIVRMQGGNR